MGDLQDTAPGSHTGPEVVGVQILCTLASHIEFVSSIGGLTLHRSSQMTGITAKEAVRGLDTLTGK